MTLSSDDEDAVYCPECGRPFSSRLDLAVGVLWILATALASVAMVLVIVYAVRTLW